jgi:hypothetical protein
VIPTLAQLPTVTPEFLKDGVLLIVGLAAGVLVFKQLFKGDRPDKVALGPQPLLVKAEERYVTFDHCNVMHREFEQRVARIEVWMDQLRSELREQRKEADHKNEIRSQELTNRIDSLRSDMESRLAAMPSQIVALLKNTGAFE